MIDEDFLQLLRCPLHHGPLAAAEGKLVDQLNSAIDAKRVKNRGGETVTEPVESGLIDQQRTLLYPVRQSIPCLLVDEAIPLDQLDQPGEADG